MILIKYIIPKMVEVNKKLDPNYEFVDTFDENIHENIHTIENLSFVKDITIKDFNFIRNCILSLIITKGGFDNLTYNEKIISSRWLLCTESQALSIGVSSESYDLYIDSLLDGTKESRRLRVEAARKDFGKEIVKGTLSYVDSNLLHTDTKGLFESYVDANNQDFINWINYTFETKSYYTPDRKQKLINRIINGI